MFLVAATVSFGAASAVAEEKAKKERTLSGKAMCAKCELAQAEKCQTAIQVAGAYGKTTTYLLADNQVSKDFHGKICKGTLDGVTVTGTVAKVDGKQVVTASKIATKEK